MPEMSLDETRVWWGIMERRGRKRAIGLQVLADHADIEPRRVQQIVQDLIRKHSKPIGSSSAKPPGYFIIIGHIELDEAYRSLRSRGIKCLLRTAKLKGIALEEVFHQARLDMEE